MALIWRYLFRYSFYHFLEIQDTVPRVVCSPLVLYLPSSSLGKPCSGNTSGYIIPSVKLKLDSDIKLSVHHQTIAVKDNGATRALPWQRETKQIIKETMSRWVHSADDLFTLWWIVWLFLIYCFWRGGGVVYYIHGIAPSYIRNENQTLTALYICSALSTSKHRAEKEKEDCLILTFLITYYILHYIFMLINVYK